MSAALLAFKLRGTLGLRIPLGTGRRNKLGQTSVFKDAGTSRKAPTIIRSRASPPQQQRKDADACSTCEPSHDAPMEHRN